MTLQEKLKAQKAKSMARIPADKLAVMGAATQALRDSGILDRVAKPGTKFSGFELPNVRNETVASGDLLSRGMLVATFYRGVW